eukprot:1359417-Amorphochlora_amoeboformis.AAC.2
MLSRTLTKALPRLSSNPLSAIRRYFSDEKEFRARCPEGVTPADNFGTMALHAGSLREYNGVFSAKTELFYTVLEGGGRGRPRGESCSVFTVDMRHIFSMTYG